MREIKFRAWYLKEKRMIKWHEIVTTQDNENFCLYADNAFSDVSPLMQYTGLKDKNGKEIYEGDLLRFEDEGEEGYEYKEGFEFTNVATVCFHRGRFELENFVSNNSSVLEDMNMNDHEQFISIFEHSEIIGNIYENPVKELFHLKKEEL